MRNLKIFAASLALLFLCAAFAYHFHPAELSVKVIPPSPPCTPLVADTRIGKASITGQKIYCPACKFTKDDKWKTVYANLDTEIILPAGYIALVNDAHSITVSTPPRRDCHSCQIVWGTDNSASSGCMVGMLPAGNIMLSR